MLFTVIALASWSPPRIDDHAFAPATPPPVVITADNVELNGAGAFDFEADERAFDIDPPAGDDGLSFTVGLWFDPAGKPVSCDIGHSRLPEAARTGCAQLMAQARFRLASGMVATFRRGFVDVEFSFYKNSSTKRFGREMFVRPNPGYYNLTMVYPSDETLPDQQMPKGDGRFVVPVEAADYPSIAIRYGLESQSAVLLGIGRDGAIRNCRPLGSGFRTAFLDNYTCTFLMQRGRFEFTPAAQSYEGLRYLRTAMRWAMPK